jgi:hypothetical protein
MQAKTSERAFPELILIILQHSTSIRSDLIIAAWPPVQASPTSCGPRGQKLFPCRDCLRIARACRTLPQLGRRHPEALLHYHQRQPLRRGCSPPPSLRGWALLGQWRRTRSISLLLCLLVSLRPLCRVLLFLGSQPAAPDLLAVRLPLRSTAAGCCSHQQRTLLQTPPLQSLLVLLLLPLPRPPWQRAACPCPCCWARSKKAAGCAALCPLLAHLGSCYIHAHHSYIMESSEPTWVSTG